MKPGTAGPSLPTPAALLPALAALLCSCSILHHDPAHIEALRELQPITPDPIPLPEIQPTRSPESKLIPSHPLTQASARDSDLARALKNLTPLQK